MLLGREIQAPRLMSQGWRSVGGMWRAPADRDAVVIAAEQIAQDVADLAAVTSLGQCPSCGGELEYAVAVDQDGSHISRWCPACDAPDLVG